MSEPASGWSRARIAKAGLLGVVGMLCFALLIRLSGVFLPVGVALLVAYILEPVITFMHRHHSPRVVTVSVVYLLFLLVSLGVGVLVVPPLVQQGTAFFQYVKEQSDAYGITEEVLYPEGKPEEEKDGGSWWMGLFQEEETQADGSPETSSGASDTGPSERGESALAEALPGRIGQWITSNTSMLKEKMPILFMGGARAIANGAGSALGFVTQFVLALFYAFFFMLHFPAFPKAVARWIPPGYQEEARELGREIDDVVAGFFRGRLLVCIISSVVTSIGLLISGIDYWLLLGIGAGFLGIIPFIGVTLTLIPSLLIAFTSGSPVFAAVGVLVTFGVVQGIVEPFVGPFVISGRVRLHPVTVTVAFMAGGVLFGVMGLLLAIPACGILKILAHRYLAPAARSVFGGVGSPA